METLVKVLLLSVHLLYANVASCLFTGRGIQVRIHHISSSCGLQSSADTLKCIPVGKTALGSYVLENQISNCSGHGSKKKIFFFCSCYVN